MSILAPRRITRDANHVYTYEAVKYPSVTTVLECLGANFSVAANYGAKHAAMAAIDLIAEIPKMVETVGRDATVKTISAAGNNYRDKAAQLGTDVHDLADRLITGKPLPEELPDGVKQRVEHYAEWWKSAGWTLRASEAMVVNPQMGYAGTLDLLCYDADHKSVLADIKTGAGVYKEAVLQETAYGDATYIETEQGFFTMTPPDRYVILHVTTTGVREVELNVGVLERLAWAACRDLYDWTQTMKGKRL